MAMLPILLLLAPLLLGAAAAPSVTRAIGNVRVIVHQLSVTPPHGKTSTCKVRQPLFSAYELRTRTADRASVAFTDRSVLRINHDTDLKLRNASMTVLSRGEVAITDSPGSHHTVQTATALVSAIGTLYDVRIEGGIGSGYATPTSKVFPRGTTTVSVVAGAVRVQNQFGSVSVHPGQWTHVPPGRPPTRPTRHNARQDVAWSTGL